MLENTGIEDKRNKGRYRLAVLAAISNIVSALLGLLSLYISISLTISYLGQERFGVWMTIASLSTMLSFLDLGISNGLISQISKVKAIADADSFKLTVTRGMTLLLVIGLVVGISLSLLNFFLPLEKIILVNSEIAKYELKISCLIFVLLFAMSIPLNGAYSVLKGLQKSWVVYLLKSTGSIISIVFIIFFSKIQAGPHYLLFATYGINTLMPLFVVCYFFRKKWIALDLLKDFSKAISGYKSLVNVGGLFFILQMGAMIGWGADTLIVSSLINVAAVAQFAIVQRLYQVVVIPLALVNDPLWPAYADANAHGDKRFIRKTFLLSVVGTFLISSVTSILIYNFSDQILELWLDNIVQVDKGLNVGFMLWTILFATGSSFSVFLNGMHIIKPQVHVVIFFCMLSLPLKIYFLGLFGVQAIVWSTVITYTISIIIFYFLIYGKTIIRQFS